MKLKKYDQSTRKNSRNLRALLVPTSLILLAGHPAWAQSLTYKNSKAPLEERVADLMARLTQDEKVLLLGGTEFTTQPIPRLDLPPMAMADAGQGVRGGDAETLGPATAFPSGVAMASTWNPDLVGRVGAAIGIEAQNKGTAVQVMLGPAVNIQRTPLGGRNGEYFSEDPFLSARLGVGYIRGMQSTGTVACIKHFAGNNDEIHRFTVNVQIPERALREIYLPSFEAGVKEGKVWTVMSSYNKLNGDYAAANRYFEARLGLRRRGDVGLGRRFACRNSHHRSGQRSRNARSRLFGAGKSRGVAATRHHDAGPN